VTRGTEVVSSGLNSPAPGGEVRAQRARVGRPEEPRCAPDVLPGVEGRWL